MEEERVEVLKNSRMSIEVILNPEIRRDDEVFDFETNPKIASMFQKQKLQDEVSPVGDK